MHDQDNTALPAADMEQADGDAPDGAYKIATLDTPVNIRVISYRKQRHDTDGVSIKAVLDGLVHAGVLSDDSSEQIKSVTFESRKAATAEDERTIIEIEEIVDASRGS